MPSNPFPTNTIMTPKWNLYSGRKFGKLVVCLDCAPKAGGTTAGRVNAKSPNRNDGNEIIRTKSFCKHDFVNSLWRLNRYRLWTAAFTPLPRDIASTSWKRRKRHDPLSFSPHPADESFTQVGKDSGLAPLPLCVLALKIRLRQPASSRATASGTGRWPA